MKVITLVKLLDAKENFVRNGKAWTDGTYTYHIATNDNLKALFLVVNRNDSADRNSLIDFDNRKFLYTLKEVKQFLENN